MMPHAIPPASSFVLEVQRGSVCNTTASLQLLLTECHATILSAPRLRYLIASFELSYSKIQSVFHCIHCWLSFDWAMPKCTFSLENLLHNAVFPVASWKLGLPLSFTFCELNAAGELSLNQKSVMMRASVLFVVLGFFSIPGPQTQSSDTWFSFMWLSKPISSFIGQKQEHFPSLRSLCVRLANSCLLFYSHAFLFLTIC